MAEVKDILDDTEGDLLIQNGDIVIGNSSMQHVKDLILAHPGHYTQSPLTGIGIDNYFNDDLDRKELQALIQKQIESDGGKVINLKVNGIDNIDITAIYED